MSDQLKATTCLFICGENLDIGMITESLNLSPKVARLYGVEKFDPILPSILDGATRNFDPKLSKGYWRLGLTSTQSKFDITKQLEFWTEKLYPVYPSFQKFKDLGYWSILDCQIASTDSMLPSIQFRLTKEIQLKLSRLCIDIDFTIYRPTS